MEQLVPKLLGIVWGTKMTPGVGGQSHLQLEILGLHCPGLGFRMELKIQSGKGVFEQFLWWGDVLYSCGVGFWSTRGFDPITICIEMAY